MWLNIAIILTLALSLLVALFHWFSGVQKRGAEFCVKEFHQELAQTDPEDIRWVELNIYLSDEESSIRFWKRAERVSWGAFVTGILATLTELSCLPYL